VTWKTGETITVKQWCNQQISATAVMSHNNETTARGDVFYAVHSKRHAFNNREAVRRGVFY
jgi:hypothetical protein